VAEASNLINAPVIIGSKSVPPILYEGTGLVADKENPLVLQILTGSSSSYSYNPDQPIKEVQLKPTTHNNLNHCYNFIFSTLMPLERILF
jgi:hypothetical protein